MNRTLLLFVAIALLNGSAFAQERLVEIILGPRDGDSAGTLYAYGNSAVNVDLWVRTAPGISVIGMHLPLSTRNDLIDSRDGIDLDFPALYGWNADALTPNNDSHHEGYTNQSFLGICCPWDIPHYDDGIHTEGEWWKVAVYLMTSVEDPQLDSPFCDGLIEGYHPDDGVNILAEYSHGELDPSTYTVQYACLEFQENLCGPYVVGDFNGSGQFNVADIISSYSRLATGSPEPGMTCECPPGSGNSWGVAMDVNGSCAFNVADIVMAYQRLALGQPELIPCAQCPPGQGR